MDNSSASTPTSAGGTNGSPDSPTRKRKVKRFENGQVNIAPVPANQPKSQGVVTLTQSDITKLRALGQALKNSNQVVINSDGTGTWNGGSSDAQSVQSGSNLQPSSGPFLQYVLNAQPGQQIQARQVMTTTGQETIQISQPGASFNILGQLVRSHGPSPQVLHSTVIVQDPSSVGNDSRSPNENKTMQNVIFAQPGSDLQRIVFQQPQQFVGVPTVTVGGQPASQFYSYFINGQQVIAQQPPMNFVATPSPSVPQQLPIARPVTPRNPVGSHSSVKNGIDTKNILRHVFNGRSIIEIADGRDVSQAEHEYITRFLSTPGGTTIDTGADSEQDSVDLTREDAFRRTCEHCNTPKLTPGRFCNKTCEKKAAVAKKRSKDQLSPVSSPAKSSSTSSPEKKPPGKRGRPKSAKTLAREAREREERDRELTIEQPASASPEDADSPKVTAVAKLRSLLRRKPSFKSWTTAEVVGLLQSMNGFDQFVAKFENESIDGDALVLLLKEDGMETLRDWNIPRGLLMKLDVVVRALCGAQGLEDIIGYLTGK